MVVMEALHSSSSLRSTFLFPTTTTPTTKLKPSSLLTRVTMMSITTPTTTTTTTHSSSLPKIDKTGRFCSPRAARELALSVLYASCLQGCDPLRLLNHRLNARDLDSDFDKDSLLHYDHMAFAGPPVTVHSIQDYDQLQHSEEAQSAIEAQVLAAPPKLVYSKLILKLTNKFVVAVTQNWDTHVVAINKVAPPNWVNEPASRILEFSILHLAMAEISVLQTRHQIVINEAVDLAKRFCDGAAPRIINGCLRTFVNDLEQSSSESENSVVTPQSQPISQL